jgi:hypothetical protein
LHEATFEVTPTLLSALQRLDHLFHSVMLWIGAIRTNQQDHDERSQIVKHISSIYKRAMFVMM